MASSNPIVVEPFARHITTGAALFINPDASWSIGPTANTKDLVKVKLGSNTSITDDTYGFSAVAVAADGKGGFRLFVRLDAQNDTIVEVAVAANGEVNPASVAMLTSAQMYAAEDQLKVDLNDNGGFGDGPVLLEGGEVNLYVSADGAYQVGTGANSLVTLKLGGKPLTDELLPAGWEIAEVLPGSAGSTKVFAMAPNGAVFGATFGANGEFSGGASLTPAELEALELADGLDIDGDSDLPAPSGWTNVLKDPKLKQLIDAALVPTASAAQSLALASPQPQTTGSAVGVTYTELVTVLQKLISDHKAANNAPITADEVASLQAIAARGKAAFTGPNDASVDYLAYVFDKMVNSSDANRFYNGGNAERSELGSLAAGASIDQFEKLVTKWILGGDMPSPVTGGDKANPKATAATAVYVKSTGELFVDGVSLPDVSQGSAGTCYLVAVMAAFAGTTPTTIEAMVVANPAVDGTRSWGVRFFDVNGKAHWVTVNDMLPTRPNDATKLAYTGSASKDVNGEIWVPLIEKAYAQANSLGIVPRGEQAGQNSYVSIEGGLADPYGQIAGGKVSAYRVVATAQDAGVAEWGNAFQTLNSVDRTDAAAVTSMTALLAKAINDGKSIWVGVLSPAPFKDSFGNTLLQNGHAHYLLDADKANPSNTTVLAYNPWGLVQTPDPAGPVESGYLSPVPYTLEQLVGLDGLFFALWDGMPG